MVKDDNVITALILEAACSYRLNQKVGTRGLPITKIERYEENGEMAAVSWFKIITGNIGTVYARVNGKFVVEVRYD